MNKWFLHILFVCVTSMLVISCQDTEDDYMSSVNNREAQIMFTLSMDSPTARTRAAWGQEQEGATFLPGDDKESRIDMSQFIVKFEADGDEYLVTNILKWEDKDSKSCNFVGIVKDLDGNNLKQSITPETVKISVYVNMGSETIADDFEQSQSESTIPMWGVVTLDNKTFAPGERTNVGSVHLLRAMAKLEVTLTDQMKSLYALKGATLNKHNTQGLTLPKDAEGATSTLLMDQEGVFNPKASLTETAKELAVLATDTSYVIYLPEVASTTANPLNVAVEMVERETGKPAEGNFNLLDYSVNPDQPSDMNLVRNHWYKYEISGFAANDIKVNLVKKIWVPVDITVGGEGFLFLNKDLIEIYNANIDSLQLKFASSSPITSIELVDKYNHANNGEIVEGTTDGVSAYYISKYGQKVQLGTDPGFDVTDKELALARELVILDHISAEAEADILNGGITIYSPFMAEPSNEIDELKQSSHYDTPRYLEFLVTNEQGLTATFRVMQYPPVVITNEEGYFSYRSDQKYSEDQEEASHFHNYQGWKSIHLSGLMFYHVHDWTAGYENTLECCPSDSTKEEYKYNDYSWVGTDCGKPGLAPCEVVHYGNIGAPHSFVDSRGVEVKYTYGDLYRSTVGTADAFLRHRYYKLPGAQSTGIYKEQKLNGQIVGGYKISSKYYYHPQGDVQGLAIGRAYEKDGRIYRKHYTWNVNPIFYNLYVDKVYQVASSDRKPGEADIHQMTHATTTYYGDEGTGWGSWGRVGSYKNHRMYQVKTTVSTSEYVIGVVELIDKDGNPTNDAVSGVAANSKRNANIISPSFMVASQLGETNYQSIVNSAADYPNQYIVPDAGNFYKLAVDHCREYVETTYKDLNNNYQWDKGEPVTHYNDWRLPTKAEINKIIDLQNTSRAMDKLLVGQYYFCAAGAGDNADTSVKENWVSNEVTGYTSGKTGFYIRCVRDVKPEGQNGFLEGQKNKN